ncbi:MAG TPA: Do family serine endopeptidase [Burkholderiaceae bacterium]
MTFTVAPVLAQRVELPDFSELAERVGPAVVNIRVSQKLRAPAGQSEMNEQMQEFLRRFGIPLPKKPTDPRNAPPSPPKEGDDEDDDDAPQRKGVGSGFLISADGFVMTNAHVVDGADELLVTLTDKREFKAKLIGTDARTDVAVLKIEAGGLPVVRIGDVGKLRVGQWVMAIGSPFGFENTVTAGIVSAKQRDTGDFLRLIQTDVAINPGNSGGPLLNLKGEVVGINSQIYSRSGGFMGISFAIPIDEAMRVSEQLRSRGKVTRGMLGVLPSDLSKEQAEAIGLGKPEGALVSTVNAGSPAEKAGIEGGDVITKFDGKAVKSAVELRRIAGATAPDTKVIVQVYRRGAYKDLSVTLAALNDDAASGDAKSAAPAAAPLGLRVGEIDAAQKQALNLRGGVKVEAAEGAAAQAGLKAGDLVLSVNNVEITSVAQFDAELAKYAKAKVIPLTVRRDNVTGIVLLRPAR